MSSWYALVPLQGFVFFGTASLFYAKLKVGHGDEHPRANSSPPNHLCRHHMRLPNVVIAVSLNCHCRWRI
jgi:hypothetical protein